MRISVEIGDECLSLRKRNGKRYRLSFLQLNGLGIRDLVRQGKDVLVLAGPAWISMPLSRSIARMEHSGASQRRTRRSSWVSGIWNFVSISSRQSALHRQAALILASGRKG